MQQKLRVLHKTFFTGKMARKFTRSRIVTVFTNMRSFAQEKKSQQAPEIDALVRDRKVFAWCHKIN